MDEIKDKIEEDIKCLVKDIRKETDPAEKLYDLEHLREDFERERQLRDKEWQLHEEERQLREKELKLRAGAKVQDITYLTIRRFSTPDVPPLKDLAGFMRTKPTGLNFPVSSDIYEQLRQFDGVGLFSAATGLQQCVQLEAQIRSTILPAPETGTTEVSFIPAWHTLLHNPIKSFMTGAINFRMDRYTNFATGTLNMLPDYVGYVGAAHYSLLIGEEKSDVGEGDPRLELIEKREWCYKSIPYVLGYFARGLLVTIVALYPRDGQVKCQDLDTYNLAESAERIRILVYLFNMSRVLAGLHHICEQQNEETEIQTVKLISTGKSVILKGKEVIKGFPSLKKRKQVWEIYKDVKGCPNAEKCLSKRPKTREDSGDVAEYALRFSPRLSRRVQATNELSFMTALVHVATTLDWLARNGFMHRDVHWRNIGLNEATGIWTLIDFDESCRLDSNKAMREHRLSSQVHAPEMLVGPHSTAVDVWGLGYLIKSAAVRLVNCEVREELESLMEQCMEDDPEARPKMRECLKRLEVCRSKLVGEKSSGFIFII